MAIRTRDELMSAIKTRIGDDTSDDALSLIEDMEDTITDYESRANTDGEDWKRKYEENDAEWRRKYKERFFSGNNDDDDTEPTDTTKQYTFDELFEEV